MMGRSGWIRSLTAILMLCAAGTLALGTAAQETEEVYVENTWGFVDSSMDVSLGIPEYAVGRLEKIREAGKLTVATEPYFPPQEFIDPSLSGQTQYVGADIELAKVIAQKMGVELEIIPLDFSDVLFYVREGEYDLAISGLAYTPGRASGMELSKGYHFSGSDFANGLMIREEDKERIKGVEDLEDQDIAAQSASLQEMLMAENVVHYRQFRRYSTISNVYRAVQEGRAAAAAVDLESADVYIRNNPGCGLYLVPDVYFDIPEPFAGDRVAAKKGEIQLMYFVNGVIDELLATGQYEEWFEEYAEYAGRLGL